MFLDRPEAGASSGMAAARLQQRLAALGTPVNVIAARNRSGETEDFHIGLTPPASSGRRRLGQQREG
jgi:hypothetical protein